MRDRRVKATIFGRSEPRPIVRMTERTESVGALLDDEVLEKGFFTGPVSAAEVDPCQRIAERDCNP
jgi:hypothetical protein